ncbi:caspase-3-like, partial [Saccoglossus kowalevskii]
MEHPRRGCAIIINNKNFENMEQRNGTEVDAHSLKTTLDKLAFDVDEHTDLSKDDMVDIIKTISQTDHRDCDCLVIAILSHGDDGIVHGTDGESVAIESLTEYFHGDRCPSLVGKPKLFFIQSCRGHKSDDGVPFESDGSEVPDSCTKHQQRIPRTADILVFYSTVQGYYSWRDPVHGSWFIQSLSHVLQKYSQTRSMQDMLTIVTNRVASLYETSNKQKKYDKKKQVPSMITTLTKR